ncbi:MAG: hypothetical protein ACI9AF_000995 [Granulosicoccus sp.]|jgi:hypothetical protein
MLRRGGKLRLSMDASNFLIKIKNYYNYEIHILNCLLKFFT